MVKQRIIDGIINREGGSTFTDDKQDSGGKTRWGITEAAARAYGYYGPIATMPRSVAVSIYDSRYLQAIRFDDIYSYEPKIAEELADTAVNCGVLRAGKFLQRSLNVLNDRERLYKDLTVDGVIGSKTVNALYHFLESRYNMQGNDVLLAMLNCLQCAYYIKLAEKRVKDERFIFGWVKHRVLSHD